MKTKRITIRTAVLLGVILTLTIGCATKPKAPIIEAARTGGSPEAAIDPAGLKSTGVIYHFKAGDRIELFAEAGGDIIAGKSKEPLTLEVKRELYFYSGPGGMLLSEDGENYKTIADFLRGRMAFSLGIQNKKQTNRADLKIHAVKK